jgi:hypothetical protein
LHIRLLLGEFIDLFLADDFLVVFMVDELHDVQLELVFEQIQDLHLLSETLLDVLKFTHASFDELFVDAYRQLHN